DRPPARGRRGADPGPLRLPRDPRRCPPRARLPGRRAGAPAGGRGLMPLAAPAAHAPLRPLSRAAALLLGLLLPLLAAAAPAPRIGVVTMAPGEVFFERFGHDAIVVYEPDTGRATSYNFGFFDPEEPDFVARFVRGEMMYYL